MSSAFSGIQSAQLLAVWTCASDAFAKRAVGGKGTGEGTGTRVSARWPARKAAAAYDGTRIVVGWEVHHAVVVF